MLLAAATSVQPGDHVVDLGAGVGAAGLAVARRVADVSVVLVEIDPALAALASDNAVRNGFQGRVRSLCLDVTGDPAAFASAGLAPSSVDHVLMNPPFNAARNPSPDARRRLARDAGHDTLTRWLTAAARLLRPSGIVTLIWRADDLAAVIAALAHDFGTLAVLPVHPKPASPAIRVLVRAVKASRAPLMLLPGLILADAEGKPTPEAEAVLRHGAALPLMAG
jgi:tRNA1(Val) A37 N6-methylase TrmN6